MQETRTYTFEKKDDQGKWEPKPPRYSTIRTECAPSWSLKDLWGGHIPVEGADMAWDFPFVDEGSLFPLSR